MENVKTIDKIREDLRTAADDPDPVRMARRVRNLSRMLDMAIMRSSLKTVGNVLVDSVIDGMTAIGSRRNKE